MLSGEKNSTNTLVLRLARHLLLLLSLVSLGAVLDVAWELHRTELFQGTWIPPDPEVITDVQEASDLPTLKKVCSLLVVRAFNEEDQRTRHYSSMLNTIRVSLKLALGFAVASCVVLLLGWVAAGSVLRSQSQRVLQRGDL